MLEAPQCCQACILNSLNINPHRGWRGCVLRPHYSNNRAQEPGEPDLQYPTGASPMLIVSNPHPQCLLATNLWPCIKLELCVMDHIPSIMSIVLSCSLDSYLTLQTSLLTVHLSQRTTPLSSLISQSSFSHLPSHFFHPFLSYQLSATRSGLSPLSSLILRLLPPIYHHSSLTTLIPYSSTHIHIPHIPYISSQLSHLTSDPTLCSLIYPYLPTLIFNFALLNLYLFYLMSHISRLPYLINHTLLFDSYLSTLDLVSRLPSLVSHLE